MIEIDYDEEEVSSYRGIWLRFTNNTLHFFTGDPVQDWADAMRHVPTDEILILKSSCDHFVMDAAGQYRWDENENLVRR